MTLMAFIAARAPFVRAKLRIIRCRSGSYRGLVNGGAVFSSAGAALLASSAILAPDARWFPVTPILEGDPIGILLFLGWLWLLEGTVIAVVGIVISVKTPVRDFTLLHAATGRCPSPHPVH